MSKVSAVERRVDLQSLRTMFEEALREASKERDQRMATHDGEVDWIRFERDLMHRLVNNARRQRGRPEVSLQAVRRCEQLAVGHVDYAIKFPLYLAELVLLDLCTVCGVADCNHQRIRA